MGQLVGIGAGCDPADALEDLLGDRWIEQGLAATDCLQRSNEVASPDLLEEVAACTGDDRREDGLLVRIARQHDNPRLGQLGPDLATRLDTRTIGQADVHHDDIGLIARRHCKRLGHRAGLGDDLEALPSIEERDEALPDDLVIVDDEEPQRAGGYGIRAFGIGRGDVHGQRD